MVDVLLDTARRGNVAAMKGVIQLVSDPRPAVQVNTQNNSLTLGAGRGEGVLRKLAAYHLHVHRHASGVVMANLLEVSLDGVDGLLAHEWFEVRDGQFWLSQAGRRAVA